MTQLKVGQFVDARSSVDRKWYAVQVLWISSGGDVQVHYPGWTKDSDETISFNRILTHIAPLYSHSVDRRKWEIGDLVDYLSLDLGAWVQVPIVAVDKADDTVAVQLDQSQMDLAMQIEEGSVEWLHLCSENIAPLRTFTKAKNKRKRNETKPSPPATSAALSVPAIAIAYVQSDAVPVPTASVAVPSRPRTKIRDFNSPITITEFFANRERAASAATAQSSSTTIAPRSSQIPECNLLPAQQQKVVSRVSTSPPPEAAPAQPTPRTKTPSRARTMYIPPKATSTVPTITSEPYPVHQTIVHTVSQAPIAAQGSWLDPLLRARLVSEQHIKLCEQALISDEGFTDSGLFASLQEPDMAAYLNRIGITPRGVQMKIIELHKTLQGP